MQLADVLGDDNALGIRPRTLADAVARVDRRTILGHARAQIGLPGLAAGSCCLREALAVRVRSGEAAEVAALAKTGAGGEERHLIVLRKGAAGQASGGERGQNGGGNRKMRLHCILPDHVTRQDVQNRIDAAPQHRNLTA